MKALGSLVFLIVALALGVSLALAAPPAPSASPAARVLPPGATVDDPGPSTVVFPPQSIPLRFDHQKHMVGLQCTSCHDQATKSTSSADRLLPSPRKCDGCHGTDHTSLDAVKAGPDAEGQCAFCHVGYAPEAPNRVAPVSIPPPNLVFDHRAHAARNIGCGQCHGAVESLAVATRDQLPRMRGCFKCHQMPDSAARGTAKSDCLTCHVPAAPGDARAGRMKVVFAQGALLPPRWLHNAAHTPDWIDRHKMVAANDSQFCSNCHKEDFCADCHDGRVRPRSIHPGDYLNMHAIEARLASERCTSCHREQSFCLSCHQRVGVSMSGPAAVKASGRFHPPKSVWSDPPRQRGHHAEEAQRNLNACVSCHVERDCVVCHGGAGIGGGFNPHKPGFAAACGAAMRRNARPCFVCHEPGAAVLAACR